MTLHKTLFISMVEALRDQNDKDLERAKLLSDIYGRDIDPTDNSLLTSAIFQVLKEAFGDEGLDDIQHFCFELDYGRNANKGADQLWEDLLKGFSVDFEEVKG